MAENIYPGLTRPRCTRGMQSHVITALHSRFASGAPDSLAASTLRFSAISSPMRSRHSRRDAAAVVSATNSWYSNSFCTAVSCHSR